MTLFFPLIYKLDDPGRIWDRGVGLKLIRVSIRSRTVINSEHVSG